MPNGRSGSLFLNKAAFTGWLSGRDGNEIIGRRLAPGEADGVSVEMIVGMLATYPADRIVVEEQDGHWYIVHMYYPFSLEPPDLGRWILIRPESSLFEELQRQHIQQGRWGAGLL